MTEEHYPIKRHYKGKSLGIYFHLLNDDEIQDIVDACQSELEWRSQEQIKVGNQGEK